MGAYAPGRLARTLAPITGAPVFAFYSDPTGGIYDENIAGAVIHRGKDSPAGGSDPSTLEITLRGQLAAAAAGADSRLFLRETPAARLGAYLGVSGPALALRFAGRLTTAEVADTGKTLWTSFAAVSWIAQSRRATRTATPTAGRTLSSLFTDVLNLGNPARGLAVSFYGTFPAVATAQDPVTFDGAVSRYGEDVGILFRETRDGRTQIMTLPYRVTLAATQVAAALPLTRSQAISPATWSQSNEQPADAVAYTITNAAGGIATRTASIFSGDPYALTTAVDWSYLVEPDTGGQLYQAAYARVFSSSQRQFRVPSITVDLLALIGSPKQYHRDQAGRLLLLEVGDVVAFANDWPAPLQGVHIATGISETLDANTWSLVLHLVPYAQALGLTSAPPVTARTWNAAPGTWNTQTKKWNES